MSISTFADLNLSHDIMNALAVMGFSELSPIQQKAIPAILEGHDIIGQAQTGTGKTAAFAIPVIEQLDPEIDNIQALILCPTRELVIQVTREFNKLLRFKEGIVATAVYGGQPIERQLRALKKNPQIIIGTPGRTMDHMRRGSINIEDVRFVILDEADEMLDMGFREDIEVILEDTPEERQTIMISATMAPDIKKLTQRYQQDTIHIDVTDKKVNAPKIDQIYYEVKDRNKAELLVRILDIRNVKLALVFCNTRSRVNDLVEFLKDKNYFADGLHGDLSQNQRDKVMNSFRKGTTEILVATDVAGRGIDVDNIEAVFNYDLPEDDEDYIHRIGRTGRAGKTGVAITFVCTSNQINHLRKIEKLNEVDVKKAFIPTIKEVKAASTVSSIEKIKTLLDSEDLGLYIEQVEQLIDEETSATKIAAALLKQSVSKTEQSYDETIDFENPIDHREIKKKPSRKKENRRRRYSGGFAGKRNNDQKRSNPDKQTSRNRKQKNNNKPYAKKFSTSQNKKRKFKSAKS